jgi:hypothetical protein
MCEISSYACPWRFQAPQVLHMSSFHLPVIVDIGYYLPWLISTQYPFTWVCLKNYAKQIPEFGKSLNHFPYGNRKYLPFLEQNHSTKLGTSSGTVVRMRMTMIHKIQIVLQSPLKAQKNQGGCMGVTLILHISCGC